MRRGDIQQSGSEGYVGTGSEGYVGNSAWPYSLPPLLPSLPSFLSQFKLQQMQQAMMNTYPMQPVQQHGRILEHEALLLLIEEGE